MASDVFIRFRGDASSAVRAGAQTQGALAGVRGAASRMAGALATASKVGALALAAGLAVSVKEAISFESSFAGVRKTVDATEPQFRAMAKGIRDMATEIPTSANELNKIAESAGQLGIRREAILGFTRVVADLGETTNLVGEEAASSLARIANVMATPQKAFDRLGSTIVALGNAGASTEAEIVAMGLRIAGAGKVAGLTEADVLGFANALSSVGIEAQAGGTAISRVMIDISTAVAGGGKDLDAFAEVAGLSSQKFARAFEDDAAGAIVTFIEGLGKIDKEGGNVFKILQDLGLSEIRVRDALLRAAGAGDLFRESLKLGSEAWKENTALTEEAARRYETTAAKLQVLRNSIVDIAISVGDALIPAIAEGAERVAGLLRDVREADGMRARISVVFEGIRSAVGGLVGAIRDALLGTVERKPLKLETGKIIEWETTETTGLVDRLSEAFDRVDWTGVGESIVDGITNALQRGAEIGRALARIVFDAVGRINWEQVGAIVGPGLATALLAAIAAIGDPAFWARNWELIIGTAAVIFRVKLAMALGKALRFAFGTAFRGIGAFFGGLIDDLVPFARTGAARLVAGIQAGLRNLPGVIRMWVLLGARALGQAVATWVQTAIALARAVLRAIARILDDIFPTVRLAVTMGLRALRSGVAGWAAAGVLLGARVVAGVVRSLARLAGRVSELVGNARSAIARLTGLFFETASYIGSAIVNGVMSAVRGLPGALAGAVADAARAALSAARSVLRIGSPSREFRDKVGKPIGDGIAAGIAAAGPNMRRALRKEIRDLLRDKSFDQFSQIVGQIFQARLGRRQTRAERQLERGTAAERQIARVERERQLGDLQRGLAEARQAAAEQGGETPAALQLARVERERQLGDLQQAVRDANQAGDQAAAARAHEEIRLFHLREQGERERAALERKEREEAARAAVARAQEELRLFHLRELAERQRAELEQKAQAQRLRLEEKQFVQMLRFNEALERLGKRLEKDIPNRVELATIRRFLRRFGIRGYAEGGTVPGPLGRPQLAVVHGGEDITPPGRRGGVYFDLRGSTFLGTTPRDVRRALADLVGPELRRQIRLET